MTTQPHDIAPQPQPQPPAPADPQPVPPRPRRAPRPASSPDPDGPTRADIISHPLLAGEALAALGGVGHLADLPPTAAAVGGATLTAASAFAAHERYAHLGTTAGTLGAGAAATAWMHHAMADTPWSLTALCTLAVATATSIPLYGLVRWRQTEASEKVVAARRAENAEKRRHSWEEVLNAAGVKGVYIDRTLHDGQEWIHGERRFPGGFSLALTFGANANVNEARDMASYVPAIQRMARIKLGLRLRPGAIQVLPREYSGEAEMVVPTRDILSETFYAPEDYSPRSIYDDLVVGRLVDGTPAVVNLQQDPHGLFSGATNSGKTTYLDAHIYELTRCIDNRTWAICGHKPSRFFASWMAPFFEAHPDPVTGQPCEPIFDWIAGDLEEATRMLLDAYKAVDWRQTSAAGSKDEKWKATPESPAITIVIDESPDLLESTERVTTHRGEKVTFSELVLKLVRLARSENIHVIMLTQRGTMSLMGDKGSDIKSQLTYRAGFKAQSSVELTAVFATDTTGVKLEGLPPGAYYLERTGFARPVLAKGLYLPKERKMEIARQHSRYAGPIDDWTAEQLDYYAERWTRESQQEFFRELCKNPVRTVPGTPLGTAPAAATSTSEAPAETEPTNGMQAFEQWMNEHHPGQPPTNERLSEFMQWAWDNTSDDDKRTAGLDPTIPLDTTPSSSGSDDDEQRRAEVAFIESLFYAPAAEPDRPTGAHDGPVEVESIAVANINPDLDDDIRQLLGAIAASGLLTTEDEYLTSDELNDIATEHLGWPFGTDGKAMVAAALRKVNVERHGRKRITVGDKTKRCTVYLVADLRAALDAHTIGE